MLFTERVSWSVVYPFSNHSPQRLKNIGSPTGKGARSCLPQRKGDTIKAFKFYYFECAFVAVYTFL